MSYKKLFVLYILFVAIFCQDTWGQQYFQTVRGTILDADSRYPLEGATVFAFADSTLIASTWCESGSFRFDSIPVGKISLRITYAGYKERLLDNIPVTSGKEVVLEIEMEVSTILMKEIEIRAKRDGAVSHEMAPVSARQFSVEETDRYAGSRGDPARMASNFAGVQGADDSRNDIVIRGNSPQSILWRLEGIDIPNPNHFNIPGTAGGPVSIINNKYLANSEFYTGAFPADFGNSLGGVFNLKMRNGNNENFEGAAQFGFLGTELFLEGPLRNKKNVGTNNAAEKKSGSSFLASYRYSTVELFSLLGIDIGTDAVPRYQDGAFRLFFPGKNNDAITVWGLGGKSSVDILISDQTSPDQRNIYGENDRDQYFKTRMGTLGGSYQKTTNERTYFRLNFALMADEVDSYHEIVYRHLNAVNEYVVDSVAPLLDYRFAQSKQSFHGFLHHRTQNGVTIRAGLISDRLSWNMIDSARSIDSSSVNYYQWSTRWNSNVAAFFIQPYFQFKKTFSSEWTATAGLHASLFTLNHSISPIEPRIGLTWQVSRAHTIAFGAGLHSQLQQAYLYFYEPDSRGTINRNMDFTYSYHYVLSHEWQSQYSFRIKSEIYYQSLQNVPVEKESSSFSLLNTGAGFSRFFPSELQNKGSGTNLGAEVTIERFFSNHWLFLFTASVFDSRYTGSDEVERNTDFNGQYAVNFLMSKEWSINQHNALVVGMKITTTGGRWYGPADISSSNEARELVFVDSLRNTLQFAPYFRFDIKLNYRINRKKVSHEIGIDLVNVLNTQNVLKISYAPDQSGDPYLSIREEYQLGFLPIFFYKFDF